MIQKLTRLSKHFLTAGFFFISVCGHGQSALKVDIAANSPGARISPAMWGVFFEDINFAADGGLYAEMVKNRSFEFPMPMMGWKQSREGDADAASLVVNRSQSESRNPRYLHVSLRNGKGRFVLTNEGFRGMGIKQAENYDFSIMANNAGNGVRISVEAVNEHGEGIGFAELEKIEGAWKNYKARFKATQTSAKARLNIIFEGKGEIDIDMASLFPEQTWKHRPGGLRADLVQKLADLHPGFVRFPGGCIVEGRELLNRYQWKKTIGDVADRQLIMNRWNAEFSSRSAPDYFQSFGLGFFEYFQLCEDIGAEPLPILNCGMACQYNSAEVVAVNEIDPYVQDALDLIEFANGGAGSKWGALRIALGHPRPFNLKMMGVGNEQWGAQYVERYKLFAAALREKYPEVKLITSAGPGPDGGEFDFLTRNMRANKADFLDEHYYQTPDWFLKNASRYDGYERGGTSIFAGEYAAHIPDWMQKDPSPESHNTWWSALSEAAFMTGLERNADVVRMASYAPLLAHVDAWQWRPDLIWFDNLRSVATPNYYVQKLFANYKGTAVLPVTTNQGLANGRDSLYCSAVVDSANHRFIVKLVNASASDKTVMINLHSALTAAKGAQIELSAGDRLAFNSLEHPDVLSPVITELPWKRSNNQVALKRMSVNVFLVPFRKTAK